MTQSIPKPDGTDAMHTCEHHEADLSAILDGELAMVELTRTLDHLVACPACADFYRRSRLLDRAVAADRRQLDAAESEPAIQPPDELWQRIAERAPWSQTDSDSGAVAGVTPLRSRRAKLREWAPRLAAVFVLAFGLWMVHLVTRGAGSAEFFLHSPEASADVLTEEEVSEWTREEDPLGPAPEMSEQRFVALATEVLQADSRYHYEMLDVLKTVTRADSREAAVDDRAADEEAPASFADAPDERGWR